MIGETLGRRYKLLRLLGRGGMGTVYEAEQAGAAERVAVKVLHGHLLVPGGEGPRRFQREAEAVRAIRSEHIVRVLDTGTDETTGHLYLVTELLEGEDLQKLLDRAGVLAVPGVLGIAAQALSGLCAALSGLCAAHAAGVVHRDIKPANIFLARRTDGTVAVKLLDFGIAKMKAEPLGAAGGADLTTTGAFLGSPLYMSPEQVQNSRDVDHRTDLWSIACALYACLAGRAPHQHLTSIGQLLVAICVSPAPSLAEIAPWVPREVAEVVHRALALSPGARPPSAAAMLEAIHGLSPAGVLTDELLVSSGTPRVISASTIPPSPAFSTPRVIVAKGSPLPVRGDDATVFASPAAQPPGLTTLGSAPDLPPQPLPPLAAEQPARSGVPAVGTRVAGRQITVDPRRILGETSELWTFSLDVHRNLSSLLSRIWKSLRRAGAAVPPMTYGKEWVLFEPRTGRLITEEQGEDAAPKGLEAAGIRPGTILWIVRPEGLPPAGHP